MIVESLGSLGIYLSSLPTASLLCFVPLVPLTSQLFTGTMRAHTWAMILTVFHLQSVCLLPCLRVFAFLLLMTKN